MKIKLYISNFSNTSIGGGWTFLRNLLKGLEGKVEIVDNWKECDIYFVFGITTIDKGEIYNALSSGKKLVLRVDNIPRKSRNKRQSPVARLKEFGNLADAVIYQGEWCKYYAGYFIDNKKEYIINNGVDTSIFNEKGRETGEKTYLYINYNDNPNKRFDEALYRFDMEWRKNNGIKLIIAGDAPRIYKEHPEYDWDLPIPADIEYVGIKNEPKEVAELMRKCDYLLYPSFCEAYPNTLLEAMACGMKPLYLNSEGGSLELYKKNLNGVKTIQVMADEYMEVFKKLVL